MANENLVSNVQYKGQVIGRATLVIEDTSRFPSYDVVVTDGVGGEATLNALKQLSHTEFEIQSDVGKIPGVDRIYVRQTTSDGKLNALMSTPEGSLVKEVSVALDTNGNCIYSLDANFFPSLLGYSGKVEFFHDAERTLLFRAYDVSVKPLNSASLVATSESNWDGNTSSINIESGDSVVFGLVANGEIGTVPGSETNIGYFASIGSKGVTDLLNPWVEGSARRLFPINNNGLDIRDRVIVKTKVTPTSPDNGNISFSLGELRANNILRPKSFVKAYSLYNLSTAFDTEDLSLKVNKDLNNTIFGIAIGSSGAVEPSNRLGSYRLDRKTNGRVGVQAYRSRKGSTAVAVGPYIGNMTVLSWDLTMMDKKESRAQFGKFQQLRRKTADGSHGNTMFEWAEFVDAIADGDYGVVADLRSSDVVLLATTENESGRLNIYRNATNFAVNTSTTAGNYTNYVGPITILALRKTSGFITYAPETPYPRVVRADVIDGVRSAYGADWVINAPGGLGVDLRNERYQVQYTHEARLQGTQIGYSWRDISMTRSETSIVLNGAFANTNPDPMNIVVWDMGPDFIIHRNDEGQLNGERALNETAPWTTSDLSGAKNANDSSIVVMPTFDESADYFFSTNIGRDVANNPKKFTVEGTNQNGARYPGRTGLMVWDPSDLTTLNRRVQFGRYQQSLTRDYDGNGDVGINIGDIADVLSDATYGKITSFNDPNLMFYFSSEAAFTLKAVNWQPNRVVFYSQNNYVRGKCDFLFMRSFGWFNHNSVTKYPRVVYAKNHDIASNGTVTIPLDKSIVPDGRIQQYQALVMARPVGGTLPRLVPTKLTRSENNWSFTIGSNGVNNILQVAIIDYGPPSEDKFGSAFIGACEETSTMLNYTAALSTVTIEVPNSPTRPYGQVTNAWSWFGKYKAKMLYIRATSLGGEDGRLSLDFVIGETENSPLDTVTDKPTTIYLTINNGTKVQLYRNGSNAVTSSRQEYICIESHERAMRNTMRDNKGRQIPYQISLV